MTRSRASARKAGTAFESDVAAYLAIEVGDDRIERRAKTGRNDRGDITGLRSALGDRMVVECKNTNRLALGTWVTESQVEAGNDDAPIGLVVHKRRGVGASRMGDQYVTMTLRDLVRLIVGAPEPGVSRGA